MAFQQTGIVRGLTILVTGANRGIGLATVRQLAAGGAVVLVHGRDRARVQQAVAQVRGEGGRAEGFVADLASLEDTVRLAREVAERVPVPRRPDQQRWGGPRLSGRPA